MTPKRILQNTVNNLQLPAKMSSLKTFSPYICGWQVYSTVLCSVQPYSYCQVQYDLNLLLLPSVKAFLLSSYCNLPLPLALKRGGERGRGGGEHVKRERERERDRPSLNCTGASSRASTDGKVLQYCVRTQLFYAVEPIMRTLWRGRETLFRRLQNVKAHLRYVNAI